MTSLNTICKNMKLKLVEMIKKFVKILELLGDRLEVYVSVGLCIHVSLLAKGAFMKIYLGKYKEYGLQGATLIFFFVRRLRPSIYHSPLKNIRDFKHPKKYLKF